MSAPLAVGIEPVGLGEALHLHRLGLEGPWLSWAETVGEPSLGVLSAHHFVLEGPGMAGLRADFRQIKQELRRQKKMYSLANEYLRFEKIFDFFRIRFPRYF